MKILILITILLIIYFYYKINCNYLSSIEQFKVNSKPKKIAFLFLIYDSINHEELWYKFLKGVDKNKYNIYIHYKYPKKLKYFNEYKLDNCIETAWGDISLVHAMNLLLKEAYKDPSNMHFIFVSNSCVPLKKFNHIYNYLNPKFSYFGMMAKDNMLIPRCIPLSTYIPQQYIRKASQWCILNRKHTKLIIDDKDNLIQYFDYDGCVPDEHYYITFLHYYKLEKELIKTYDMTENFTTFVVWFDLDYKYKKETDYNYPKEYIEISDEELNYLLNAPCLFGRKFNKDCELTIDYK